MAQGMVWLGWPGFKGGAKRCPPAEGGRFVVAVGKDKPGRAASQAKPRQGKPSKPRQASQPSQGKPGEPSQTRLQASGFHRLRRLPPTSEDWLRWPRTKPKGMTRGAKWVPKGSRDQGSGPRDQGLGPGTGDQGPRTRD